MTANMRLSSKDVSLTITFTALYVVLGFIKISPMIGLPGSAITAAAIIAPLIGIILGPYLGTLSTFLGGVVGLFFGSFIPPNIASGIATTLCSGLIRKNKRTIAAFLYATLLLFLAFYPTIGGAWLYPAYLWFQIIGLVVLVSPLQSVAVKHLEYGNSSKLLPSFFVTCLVSTLAGQIAGSLTLEAILTPNVVYWLGIWQTTVFLYPVERVVIAVFSSIIGFSLYQVLGPARFMLVLNRIGPREKFP